MDLENITNSAETFVKTNAECLLIGLLMLFILIVLYFGVWNPSEGFCGGMDSLCMCSGNETK